MSGLEKRFRIWIDRAVPVGVEIPPDVELVDGPESADGAVVGSDLPWDDDTCRRLPQLKVVARSGIGYDNVDVAACAAHGVAACNTPDAPTVSTAEHALALMLAVAKRLKISEGRLTASAASGPRNIMGAGALELDGRTLGLVGCGRIGSLLGRYTEALGMTVLVHDPYLEAAPVGELVDLDQLVFVPCQFVDSHSSLPVLSSPASLSPMKGINQVLLELSSRPLVTSSWEYLARRPCGVAAEEEVSGVDGGVEDSVKPHCCPAERVCA